MIQTLQRLKAKKGFTIIELIVVLAIIAILIAVIVPGLSTRKARINEANSTSRDFYSALQSIMMRYSLYEGPLSPAYSVTPELGIMRYYKEMGGNYPYKAGRPITDGAGKACPPETASIYIELQVKGGLLGDITTYTEISSVSGYDTGIGLYNIALKPAGTVNNEFGKLLKAELDGRINFQDGYYYANVTYKNILSGGIPQKVEAETVKVMYTGFSRNGLPSPAGKAFGAYQTENFYFGEDNVLNNGDVFGVFGKFDGANTIGLEGTALK